MSTQLLIEPLLAKKKVQCALYSRAEAATYLRTSVRSLARMSMAGPVATRVGRRVWYTQADLDAFLAKQRSPKCHVNVPYLGSCRRG